MRFSLSLWLLTSVACNTAAFTINAPIRTTSISRTSSRTPSTSAVWASSSSSSQGDATAAAAAAPTTTDTPPPVLNGKMVLPLKVVQGGLKGHKVAGVYALVASTYTRKSGAGWKDVVHVDTALDLAEVLMMVTNDNEENEDDEDYEKVSHVRILSFSFPQQDAMDDVAQQWRDSVLEAGGRQLASAADETVKTSQNESTDDMLRQAQQNAMTAFDDDDDDWDDDDDDIEMMLPPPQSSKFRTNDEGEVTRVGNDDDSTVISPFAAAAAAKDENDSAALPFTVETVNTVLDEVRPYLIADGGNVSVDRVEEDTKNVYLKLEGACGSCASSTVTMQMGIEKVLKENFADLGQVIQVDNDDDAADVDTELTIDMVMVEVNRIGPAISAMGGQYEILSVNGEMGTVDIQFKGPNKLQQGLELALLDIPLCKYVKFSMYD